MPLTAIQQAMILFAAADSNTDFQNQREDAIAFWERQGTLTRQGKHEHAAYHKVAYETCLAELVVHPHWGVQALQMVAEDAILDSLRQAEAEAMIAASPA